MYSNVSLEFRKSLYVDDARPYRARFIRLSDETEMELDIKSLTLTRGSCGDSDFAIGSTFSSSCSVECYYKDVDNPITIQGIECRLEFGLALRYTKADTSSGFEEGVTYYIYDSTSDEFVVAESYVKGYQYYIEPPMYVKVDTSGGFEDDVTYYTYDSENDEYVVADEWESGVQYYTESEGVFEYVPMGVFTPLKPTISNGSISFEATDRMANLFGAKSLTNVAIKNLGTKILKTLTISGKTVTVSVENNSTKTSALISAITNGKNSTTVSNTYRELIGIIASFYFGYAYCDRTGNVVISTYKSTSTEDVPFDYVMEYPTIDDIETQYYMIICVPSEESDSEGDVTKWTYNSSTLKSGTRYEFSNQYFTQNLAKAYNSNLMDLAYRGGSVRIMGDPLLDPTDSIYLTVEDDVMGTTSQYTMPCMGMEYSYNGDMTMTITSIGQTDESENSTQSAGTLSSAVSSIQSGQSLIVTRLDANDVHTKEIDAQLGEIEEIQGKSLIYENGQITDLSGTTITYTKGAIDDLQAQNIKTNDIKSETGEFHYLESDQLDSKYIKADDIEADTGKFHYLQSDTLESTYANIDFSNVGQETVTELFANTSFFDDVHISNGVITGTLKAEKIIADVIQTNTSIVNGDLLTQQDGKYYRLVSKPTDSQIALIEDQGIDTTEYMSVSGENINDLIEENTDGYDYNGSVYEGTQTEITVSSDVEVDSNLVVGATVSDMTLVDTSQGLDDDKTYYYQPSDVVWEEIDAQEWTKVTNGQNIIADTVTATQIDVRDLYVNGSFTSTSSEITSADSLGVLTEEEYNTYVAEDKVLYILNGTAYVVASEWTEYTEYFLGTHEMRTIIEQKASAIDLTATNNNLSTLNGNVSKHFAFNENGLTISGSNGSAMSVQVNSDRISFINGSTEVAYMSGNEFSFNQGIVLNSMAIGNVLFKNRDTGSMSMVWRDK